MIIKVTISSSGYAKIFFSEKEAIDFFGYDEFVAIRDDLHSEYCMEYLDVQ